MGLEASELLREILVVEGAEYPNVVCWNSWRGTDNRKEAAELRRGKVAYQAGWGQLISHPIGAQVTWNFVVLN